MTNLTHLDIYTKFMIEYDKANITSSYPSLTKYEVATLLDKAYNALIAQCVTGNNSRKALFEQDVKAVEDIRPLIVIDRKISSKSGYGAFNERECELPDNFRYYVDSRLTDTNNKMLQVQLMNHTMALNYKLTKNNMPWVEQPIAYLEGNKIKLLVDPYVYQLDDQFALLLTYIKDPNLFVKTNCFTNDKTVFELNSTMAEQLINLAIVFATENVESSRLLTKLTINPLES